MNRKLEKKIIETAINLLGVNSGRCKHFSFLTERNSIISVGWNKPFKTHPIANKYGHRFDSIHSELSCIQNFPYHINSLSKYTFINLRLMSDKSLGISKPCKCCFNMLRMFKIRHIYYSCHDGFKYYEIN